MMESRIVTSGLDSLDQVLPGLRLGDNVIWQVDRLEDYSHFAEPFAWRASRDRTGDRLLLVLHGRKEDEQGSFPFQSQRSSA